MFNTMDYGILWPSKGNVKGSNGGLNFHGMFMSTGLVFFQGEALLAYRLYRYDSKILGKFIHGIFHLLTMGFFGAGLAAIILTKNVKALFGFINFILPGMSEDVKRKFLPLHRIAGAVTFMGSIIQTTIGFIQYNSIFDTCPTDHAAPLICDQYRFVFNFIIISGVLYGLSLLVLVVTPIWKRHKRNEE
ncbi:unnamed protein product [Nippostrongylus brasiliensis]|uniref:Cytochrome b561 domain-containing protein n=1 Tax=Nippostrongylus brasiliensis TaxID=27835 RepID=A0A0N4YEW4_NIPBR|nr:unnamed protein product [Nippostrongylus brasiliensis]